MTTDITELAQREKFEAWWERTQHNGNPPRFGWESWRDGEGYKVDDDESELDGMWEAWRTAGADLVEALENAQAKIIELQQGCENDPRTHEIIDLQERIAELESRTVKLPVHPTIASEKLDDETLQELIEFRRTTFEYHSKEGNRVQTIIHGVTLAALRELQERRKTEKDSEPVCFVSERNLATLTKYRAAVKVKAEPVMVRPVALYRHAQPAPVVPDDTKLRELFDSWFASDCSFDLSPEASEADNIAWRESYWYVWKRCRAAILAAARQSPGSEPATVPGKWIPVSERMPKDRTQVILWDAEIGEVTSGHYSHKTHTFYHCGDAIQNEITHWMPLPAAPQEVK